MKKQTLEEAAKDFLKTECRIYTAESKMLAHKAFKAGAEWRINSVWHDARTDVPEVYFPVLVEDDLEDFEVSMLALVEECPKNWRRWAYIDDLCLMRRTEL